MRVKFIGQEPIDYLGQVFVPGQVYDLPDDLANKVLKWRHFERPRGRPSNAKNDE